ncbi:hypothetical protein EV715DRAFT_262985 [Schizophyllum commune]
MLAWVRAYDAFVKSYTKKLLSVVDTVDFALGRSSAMKRGRSARRDQKRIADLCLSSVRLSLCGSCTPGSSECVIARTAIANAERDGLAIPILAPPPRPPPTLLINPEYPSHHVSCSTQQAPVLADVDSVGQSAWPRSASIRNDTDASLPPPMSPATATRPSLAAVPHQPHAVPLATLMRRPKPGRKRGMRVAVTRLADTRAPGVPAPRWNSRLVGRVRDDDARHATKPPGAHAWVLNGELGRMVRHAASARAKTERERDCAPKTSMLLGRLDDVAMLQTTPSLGRRRPRLTTRSLRVGDCLYESGLSDPPRSTTRTGRIAERGNDLGAASSCLVPRRALISPRRVPPPRDVGADAHAYTESSASTSEPGDCRRGWRARSYYAIAATRRAMPDDVETDVDACAAQRRFDRAGNGRNSCPASLPRRRELVPRPGRERTAAYTDVDIDLDDAKTKLRSSLTMNRPARHSPRRYTRCCSLTVWRHGFSGRSRHSRRPHAARRHAARVVRRSNTHPAHQAGLTGALVATSATPRRRTGSAKRCPATNSTSSFLSCNHPSMRRRGMSLRLRFLLSLSMMRMRLMVLPSSFGSCDGCENAGRGVSSAPFDANHRFQVLFLQRELACCDVRFGVLDFELVMGLGGCTHLCSWPNSDRHKYSSYEDSPRAANWRYVVDVSSQRPEI